MPGTLHCPNCGTNTEYFTPSPPALPRCPMCQQTFRGIDGLGGEEAKEMDDVRDKRVLQTEAAEKAYKTRVKAAKQPWYTGDIPDWVGWVLVAAAVFGLLFYSGNPVHVAVAIWSLVAAVTFGLCLLYTRSWGKAVTLATPAGLTIALSALLWTKRGLLDSQLAYVPLVLLVLVVGAALFTCWVGYLLTRRNQDETKKPS